MLQELIAMPINELYVTLMVLSGAKDVNILNNKMATIFRYFQIIFQEISSAWCYSGWQYGKDIKDM